MKKIEEKIKDLETIIKFNEDCLIGAIGKNDTDMINKYEGRLEAFSTTMTILNNLSYELSLKESINSFKKEMSNMDNNELEDVLDITIKLMQYIQKERMSRRKI